MANEILILSVDTNEDDRSLIRALFMFPMSPPLATDGGTTIVPTPSSMLPVDVTSLNMLSAGELSAMDNGTGVFDVITIFLTPTERADIGLAAAKVKSAYGRSTFVESLRSRFKFTGRRVNA
jgi:hypothetical protein